MANMDLCLDNDAARAEMKEIADRLDAGSASCTISSTWTAAASLCHLAFWDQRALFQLEQWQKSGSVQGVRLDSQSVDSINEAVNMIAQQVPGPAAIVIALNSAAAVDTFVATIGEELAERITAAGFERYLRRSSSSGTYSKDPESSGCTSSKVGIGYYGFLDTGTDRVHLILRAVAPFGSRAAGSRLLGSNPWRPPRRVFRANFLVADHPLGIQAGTWNFRLARIKD